MAEYIVLEGDRELKQEAWTERKDDKGRIVRPARPVRDEVEVSVRLNRQFRAHLRLPKAVIQAPNREGAIAQACAKLGLGQEVAPGLQVVEVETSFSPATTAVVTPEEKDEKGSIIREELFTPATLERIEYFFTLRVQGLHLVKLSLTPEEVAQPNWKATLVSKSPSFESFMR